MVFEGIVSDVLSRVLGEYVKNLNKDQLKIGVLGGNVVLTNLELKEDALANLPINLPITVKKGFLGRLELRVPWKDLKSKPVIVNIDNVYALAVPQTQSFKYDEEAEKKRELETKKKRIENYEWMKSIQESDGDDPKKDKDSFTTRLVTKIIDNLQIVVNKVHIRFENRNEIGKLYAVGLTLDRISAQSTDEKWLPSFIDSSKTNYIRKLAEMNALGVYIDDSATSLQNLSTQEFTEAFTKLIPTKLTDTAAVKKFIVKPISSQLKVSINKSDIIDKSIPKIVADCIFSDIVCALSSAQYHTIFNILNFTNEYLRDIKYLKYRPHVKVSDSPKLWWKYAGQVILEQVRQKRYTRSWEYLQRRRAERKEYISLFKRSLPNVKWLTSLSKQENAQLQALQDRLSFEDIVFYRSLAYAEIQKEAIKDKERKEFLANKKNERGFFQNLFSSKAVKMEDEKAAPIVNLTTNEREELYRTIEYSDVVQSVQEPPDWVKVAANLDIRSISLQLVETSSLGSDHSFIDAVYTALSVKLEQRPEGVKVVAGIRQFEVYDQSTKGTLYPKVISSSYTSGNASFCSAIVDTCPPEKGTDLFVELNMNPLQVVATKPLLMRIASFFSTQNTSEHLDVTNISNRAGDMLVNWTERTKSQLQEAIDSHKTLALSVNIHAPVIIVPENVLSKTSSALILDLGNFKIRSDMSQSIKGKVVNSSLSENDFYDKFNLSLESIQLLLTNDIASWNDKHSQQEHKTHLINQFDVHLKLYSCIQQDNLSLTGVKIFGDLPKLSLHLSEKKCKQLLALVNSLTADIPTSPTLLSQSANNNESDINTLTNTSSLPKPLLDLYNGKTNDNQNQSIDLLINHKKLSVEFNVQSIAVTISRENADLVRLSVDGLGVTFSQRTFDMMGSVVLNSLDIDDLFTHSNLKKLATSNPVRDIEGKTSTSSLVTINFKQFQPNSPEFKKVDMTLDVNFQSFYLVCNPPTIHQLLVLANSFADQPAITVSRQAIQTTENRKRVVRTLRAGAPTSPTTLSPGNTSPPIEGQTVIGPNGQKTVIKKVIIKKKKRSPTENISIRVTATINSLGLVLNQENNKKIGIFSINKIENQVIMYKDTRMAVKGSLGSIVLEDLTDKRGDYYNQVITPKSRDTDMLTFSFNTHPTSIINYPGYDSSVNANIKSIVVNAQIPFLLQVQNYFLGGMLDPILNRPLPAVAQSQDPNKLMVVQTPPISRTKLDVVMETPLFNVPCSIDSHDKLRLELGKIIVSNTFGELEHNGTKLPTDLMKIRMENTCIVIEKEATTSHFLKELDIDVNIQRFLVPNHNINLEDILIDITISHLSFYLDQQQYRFFLDLADNATKEMADLAANNAITQPPPPSSDIPYFSEQEVIQDMGKTLMVLKVHLPLFSFNITGPNDNFAKFDIRGLHFDLINTERKKSKIQLILESIVLTDARKNSDNIFKNLLENHPNKKNPLEPFLHVGYVRDNVLGDQYINVNVNNVCLFLSPTPLLIITDFFLKPLQVRSVPASAAPAPTTASSSPKFLAQTRKYDPFKVRTPSITLTCSASSEVTLVENETQPNTRCILGKALLHVFFKRDPRGIENAIVSVRKAKINIYRPTIQSEGFKRSQGSRPVQILKPIDHIKIKYIKENETADYWKQSITLDCSTIKLFFSYDDVNTILKIVNNLNFKQHLESQQQQLSSHQSNKEHSLSSSTGSTTSSSFTSSLLSKSSEIEQEGTDTSAHEDEQLFNITEEMTLKCPSISVLFINESMDLNLPVAELYLAEIKANATNWSTDVELKSSMTFKADYFNEANMKFEPFIEDWTYNFDVKKAGGIMKAKFIATKEILNINVSHALIQTLNSTLLLVKQKDLESSSPLSSRFNNQSNPILTKYITDIEGDKSSTTSTTTTTTTNTDSSQMTSSTSSLTRSQQKTKFHSHWISNQTGVDIEYRIQHKNLIVKKDSEDPMNVVSEVTDVEEHDHVSKIANQEMEPVHIKKEKGTRDSGMGTHETVDLLIMGGTIPQVSLDALGHRIYNFTNNQNASIDFDVEVKLQSDGSKIIYIRSLVQFANNTTCPLEIKTFEDDRNISKLEAGSSFSLPMEYFKDYKKLWFRVAQTSQWSEVVVPDEIVAQGQKEREKHERDKRDSQKLLNTPYSRIFKVVGVDKSFTYFALSVLNTDYRTTTFTSARTQFVSFNAPVQIENLLPTSFHITVNGVKSLVECGRKLDVLNYAPGNGNLDAYISGIPGLSETKVQLMSGDASSPSMAKSIKFPGSKEQREMVLNIERTEEVKGIRVLSIYCQFWLVNNTLLPLVVRSNDNDETQMASNTEKHKVHPVLCAQNYLKLKVNEKDTKFTSSTPICTVGNVSTIQVQGESKLYELSCSVDFCANTRFGLSKVVNFAPRFVIQNRLNATVSIGQYISSNNNGKNATPDIKEIMTLKPNDFAPFHWALNTENKSICIKINGEDYWWSGPFEIDTSGDLVVRIRPSAPEMPSILAHITIKEDRGTLYIIIPRCNPEHPPYLIKNDTPYKISFTQKTSRSDKLFDHLEPDQSEAFGWDEPNGDYRLQVYLDGKEVSKIVNLKKITGYKFDGYTPLTVYCTITIEKSSRYILFSTHSKKYKSITNWKLNKKKQSSSSSSKHKDESPEDAEKSPELQFFVRLSGMGISMIDSTPLELAYVSVKDVFLQIQQSEYENSLELKLGDVQIDNQSVKTEFPVLMHSVIKPNSNKDFIHISLVKSTFDNIDHFRYFSTLIQELTIDIEDHWLRLMLEFAQSLPDIAATMSGTTKHGDDTLTPAELSDSLTPHFNITPPQMDGSSLRMVYFTLLVLNPIKANITLALQNDGLFKTNHKVLSAIEGLGFTLTKLDRAPITLQGLIMEHPFSSWATMIDKLKSTYTSQALFQFYNILGSIDIIGNPVGLFRNFGTGVKDFFVEPANGIIKSPADFGKGLAKGTSSLVKNSVYGTFNTISKITGTIGSGVANLSFDDDYLHDRKVHQSRKPKHIGEGLAMGGIGLGRGLLQGITGIVTKPVEGAKKGGFAGFAKGLAQGVVGVAVKPTTAVIDATTKATEGIRNTTNLQDDKERVRPPRSFGIDNVLRPYDQRESEGWYLLKTVHKGKHAGDHYVWHYAVNSEFTVILSDQRLIYSRTKKNFLHSSFMWQIPHQFIKNVKFVPGNGLVLSLDPPQDLSLLDKSVKTLTIAVDDDNICMTFNMKLDHTLRLFNEKLGHHYKKI